MRTSLTNHFHLVASVAHQPAGCDIAPLRVSSRYPFARSSWRPSVYTAQRIEVSYGKFALSTHAGERGHRQRDDDVDLVSLSVLRNPPASARLDRDRAADRETNVGGRIDDDVAAAGREPHCECAWRRRFLARGFFRGAHGLNRTVLDRWRSDGSRCSPAPAAAWRSASMAMRWTAAAMQEAAKGFRRLKAHKQLPTLRAALEAHRNKNSPHGVIARQANAA